jgi:mannose-6-phosphate isomerase class I
LNNSSPGKEQRLTDQWPLPDYKPVPEGNVYDIYPSFRLEDNQIFSGFESLADLFLSHRQIIIDGYVGVFWDHFRKNLDMCLSKRGYRTSWFYSYDFIKPHYIIDEMISPYTGGDDPVFGKRTDLILDDFFDMGLLTKSVPAPDADINLIFGPGASLAGWEGLFVYVDIPKNEIQFRSRAGSITNLGALSPSDPKEMYKRFYFVDWIVLNRHKQKLFPGIEIFIDAQKEDHPVWMKGDVLRQSLWVMGHNAFRVRPWFEPGAWGGTWIKDHIAGLNKNVPNYAWSFELIVPENGLLFESSRRLFEVTFDSLMYMQGSDVLGDCYPRFGTVFPIRFDFLDTFEGGNLSVQCHPRPEYMKKNFGEDFTQEESYYILDTKNDAVVYLGFQDNINPADFRHELEKSNRDSTPVDIEKYVQKLPASKHDLFLIPSGTIHGSGKNNLVLEISSTPYIFTFKMYDWLRPDLDGRPRPLNIQRGMDNLYFDRKGAYVKDHLVSKPILIDQGEDWWLYHLPTHGTQLYDVHRLHFKDSVQVKTENKFHVLSLVEGTSILLETGNGFSRKFSYAETFVVSAAAGSYRIVNESDKEAIIVKAFVK